MNQMTISNDGATSRHENPKVDASHLIMIEINCTVLNLPPLFVDGVKRIAFAMFHQQMQNQEAPKINN